MLKGQPCWAFKVILTGAPLGQTFPDKGSSEHVHWSWSAALSRGPSGVSGWTVRRIMSSAGGRGGNTCYRFRSDHHPLLLGHSGYYRGPQRGVQMGWPLVSIDCGMSSLSERRAKPGLDQRYLYSKGQVSSANSGGCDRYDILTSPLLPVTWPRWLIVTEGWGSRSRIWGQPVAFTGWGTNGPHESFPTFTHSQSPTCPISCHTQLRPVLSLMLLSQPTLSS